MCFKQFCAKQVPVTGWPEPELFQHSRATSLSWYVGETCNSGTAHRTEPVTSDVSIPRAACSRALGDQQEASSWGWIRLKSLSSLPSLSLSAFSLSPLYPLPLSPSLPLSLPPCLPFLSNSSLLWFCVFFCFLFWRELCPKCMKNDHKYSWTFLGLGLANLNFSVDQAVWFFLTKENQLFASHHCTMKPSIWKEFRTSLINVCSYSKTI